MYKQIIRQALPWSLLLIFLAPTSLFAADDKQPSMAEMWVIEVKDGAMMNFENALKMHLKARKDAGDSRAWQVYTPHTGSHMNRYYIRYCCFTWADRDAYAKWGNDNKMAEHWTNNVAQYVSHMEHDYYWTDFENSTWPEGYMPAYVGVRTWKMKPGSNVDKSIKELSDLAKAMKWDRQWAWVYSMTGKDRVEIVFPYDDFAGMEDPDPSFMEAAAKHLGSEAKVKEMFDNLSENFESSKYTLYQHRTDLSMEVKN